MMTLAMNLSVGRKKRLGVLEALWREGRRVGPGRLGGEAFIEQWLVCAGFGEPGEWEKLSRTGSELGPELERLRALARAFGLGEGWESIERGDFLELSSPMFSALEPGRTSPLHGWASRWYWRHLPEPTSWWWYLDRTRRDRDERRDEADGRTAVKLLLSQPTTDRGVVHTWREVLGKCTRIHLARTHSLLYEGAGFYHASAVHLERVNRALEKVQRPSIGLLGRFVDPWGVGFDLETLRVEFGYPLREAA